MAKALVAERWPVGLISWTYIRSGGAIVETVFPQVLSWLVVRWPYTRRRSAELAALPMDETFLPLGQHFLFPMSGCSECAIAVPRPPLARIECDSAHAEEGRLEARSAISVVIQSGPRETVGLSGGTSVLLLFQRLELKENLSQCAAPNGAAAA